MYDCCYYVLFIYSIFSILRFIGEIGRGFSCIAAEFSSSFTGNSRTKYSGMCAKYFYIQLMHYVFMSQFTYSANMQIESNLGVCFSYLTSLSSVLFNLIILLCPYASFTYLLFRSKYHTISFSFLLTFFSIRYSPSYCCVTRDPWLSSPVSPLTSKDPLHLSFAPSPAFPNIHLLICKNYTLY